MQKPGSKKPKIANELTEADLAKVVGGGVAVFPVNKRRQPLDRFWFFKPPQ